MKKMKDWFKNEPKKAVAVIVTILVLLILAIAIPVGIHVHKQNSKPESTEVTQNTAVETEAAVTTEESAEETTTATVTAETTSEQKTEASTEKKTDSSDTKPTPKPDTKPAPKPTPEKKKVWVDTSHYETKTVVDKEAWDEEVVTGSTFIFVEDGYETDNLADCHEHARELGRKGLCTGYSEIVHTKKVHHPAVTHTEKVWVEEGHWEYK